jgi:ABC-type bacteriocin/lantibiotic exporter with double-glycine peptidase domain
MRPLQRLTGELSGMVVQLIDGVAKLRVAGAEERAFAYWGKQFSQQQILHRRIRRIADCLTVVHAVLPTLALVVLFWGAMRTLQDPATAGSDGFTTGTFLAFYIAFGVFMRGATSLSTTLIDLVDVATLWERSKPILAASPEVDCTKANPGRLSGKLALDRVTFRYQAQGPVVLANVSLHAEAGEFIALVGPSGSGKSTLLRLLLGFDDPECGTVYYDGRDLARLDVVAVRRQLGTVLQQSQIMAASIFENIAAGGLLTRHDAWEAARAAGLAEEIAALPMGMHTFVDAGGRNLSGGQRQRLLLARALARKPAIVLLDEATSALDNRTQAIVTASLERLQATRLVIAHRLSTIRQAHRIYVLDGGQIVQQGTFAELAHQDGVFAQLMARQEVNPVPPGQSS